MKRLLARLGLLVCLVALVWVAPVWVTPVLAVPASPEEITFWKSVSATNNPAELHAYLNAYPDGAFVAIAKNRLGLAPPPGPPPQPAAIPVAPIPVAAPALALLSTSRPSFRLVDGVTLDLDTTGLRNASNLRLTVVPASAPLAITDPDRLALESSAVPVARMRLTIPSGPPGADELRLYYIPNSGTGYQLAARVPVTIEAGVPGATLVRDLGREAAQLGPIRFEANHRDRPMLIQGAFLNLRPSGEWNMQWFSGLPVEQVSRRVLVMTIGQPNVAADIYGSTGEAVCVVTIPDATTLSLVSALNIGDPVLVAATPTSWGNARPSDPVVLQNCVLRR